VCDPLVRCTTARTDGKARSIETTGRIGSRPGFFTFLGKSYIPTAAGGGKPAREHVPRQRQAPMHTSRPPRPSNGGRRERDLSHLTGPARARVPSGMFDGDESTGQVPEIFPDAHEIMGQWPDPCTGCLRTLVRFFAVDSEGRQVGRNAFIRVFDAMDFLMFCSRRGPRSTIALESRETSGLTREEQELVDTLLASPNKAKHSFAERLRSHLLTLRRKAAGEHRPAISPVRLSDAGVISMKGTLT